MKSTIKVGALCAMMLAGQPAVAMIGPEVPVACAAYNFLGAYLPCLAGTAVSTAASYAGTTASWASAPVIAAATNAGISLPTVGTMASLGAIQKYGAGLVGGTWNLTKQAGSACAGAAVKTASGTKHYGSKLVNGVKAKCTKTKTEETTAPTMVQSAKNTASDAVVLVKTGVSSVYNSTKSGLSNASVWAGNNKLITALGTAVVVPATVIAVKKAYAAYLAYKAANQPRRAKVRRARVNL